MESAARPRRCRREGGKEGGRKSQLWLGIRGGREGGREGRNRRSTLSASSRPCRMSLRTGPASAGAIALLKEMNEICERSLKKTICKHFISSASSPCFPASLPPSLPPRYISHRMLERRKKPGVLSSSISRARASGVHSARTGNPRTLWVPVGSSDLEGEREGRKEG